jgi:hypothetical protein
MGCGAGKEDNSKKKENSIPYEMKDCKIPDFMELFSKAETLLKNAEEIRAGILDSKDDAFELIDGDRIVEPTLYDAVKALLLAITIDNGGKFPASALEVKKEAPFVVIYCGN